MCTHAHLNQHSGKDETGSYLLYWREIFIGKIEFFKKKFHSLGVGKSPHSEGAEAPSHTLILLTNIMLQFLLGFHLSKAVGMFLAQNCDIHVKLG